MWESAVSFLSKVGIELAVEERLSGFVEVAGVGDQRN
jgi:hypothetical protein